MTPIPFYVATSLGRSEVAREVRRGLEKSGHFTCTYDWTVHGEADSEDCTRVAHAEIRGVLSADLVIVLLPGGRGTHAELGAALASGKRVLLHYELPEERFKGYGHDCSFYYHHNVTRICCPVDGIVARIIQRRY